MSKKLPIEGVSKLNHIYYNLSAAFLIGASLYKLLNWPGADFIFVLGGFSFSLAYIIKSFDFPYETADWSLAFPTLKKDTKDGS